MLIGLSYCETFFEGVSRKACSRRLTRVGQLATVFLERREVAAQFTFCGEFMRYHSFPLTLRQLQYVSAVAEELNFRRAAERCLVSQPSLSAQIVELERTLGVQFFERDRRSVMLTRAGEELLSRVREVLLAAEDLEAAAKQHGELLSGPLRIGVIPTIGPYLLPDLDPALREKYPRLELRWREGKTEDLVKMLRKGELDAALLALEAELGDLEHASIGEDTFVLAASPSHPLGLQEDPISVDALAEHKVLLLDDGHCFRDQALDFCALVGAQERGFRATSLSTLSQMVSGNQGLTILPAMAVEVENRRASLVIRHFCPPAPRRTIALAWRKGSPLAKPLQTLTQSARTAYLSTHT